MCIILNLRCNFVWKRKNNIFLNPVAKSLCSEVHCRGQEGAWGHGMWVDESAKWSRGALWGLRGTEALCWQTGDLTDCIVHTLLGPREPHFIAPFPVGVLYPTPSTFNLASFISPRSPLLTILTSLFLTKPTSIPFPRLLLWLPLATRHSQMSAGSCITETARLSAVVTWHLKAVRAWDTVTSHATLIAAYWLLEDSSENKAVDWYHKAKGCFLTFLCVLLCQIKGNWNWTDWRGPQTICVSVHFSIYLQTE